MTPNKMKNTPDNITKLEPGQIFVFGSNYNGWHSKGAALTARQKFGAVYGEAEGLMGQSYALPTVGHKLSKMPLDEIEDHVYKFIEFAEKHPELTFLLTEVGCGLAGHRVEDIAPMFLYAPMNVIKPLRFEMHEGIPLGEQSGN